MWQDWTHHKLTKLSRIEDLILENWTNTQADPMQRETYLIHMRKCNMLGQHMPILMNFQTRNDDNDRHHHAKTLMLKLVVG